MAIHELRVPHDAAGKRIDVYLADAYAFSSRSAAANAIENEHVLINGRITSKNARLHEGDIVSYEDIEPTLNLLGPEQIPLDVRYADDGIIVLSKQRGLVCHPSHDHASHTLVNALVYRFGAENLCNIQGEDDRLGIVHRLDMDTSGLMICAKTNEAGLALMDAIRARSIDRHYLALVHGVIAFDTGMIDAPIMRSQNDRLKMAVGDGPSSRSAMTTFTVVERFEPGEKDNGYTLLDCKLFSGRTHQIRVHMEYTKHPVVGDPIYTAFGPKAAEAQLGLDRQFLHSYRLVFSHPESEEELSFVDNLPDDLSEALQAIRPRSIGTTDYGMNLYEELKTAPVPCITAFTAC